MNPLLAVAAAAALASGSLSAWVAWEVATGQCAKAQLARDQAATAQATALSDAAQGAAQQGAQRQQQNQRRAEAYADKINQHVAQHEGLPADCLGGADGLRLWNEPAGWNAAVREAASE